MAGNFYGPMLAPQVVKGSEASKSSESGTKRWTSNVWHKKYAHCTTNFLEAEQNELTAI